MSNVGILGCASIARKFMISATTESTDFTLAGIASRDPQKAADLARESDCKSYHSYQDLLHDDSIDAVYIPLPTGMHYEWVSKAVSAGKHVLCEKSLCERLEQTVEIMELAEKKSVVVCENFMFEEHTQIDTAKSLIDDGRIGEIRSITASFGFPPFVDVDNIRYSSDLGGGALLDAGAYVIKAAQIFAGSNITCLGATLDYQGRSVDILGSALLYSDKTKITAHTSWGFNNFYKCEIDLWGSKGRITLDRAFTAGPVISPKIAVVDKTGQEVIVVPRENHFVNMLGKFAKLIRHEESREQYTLKVLDQSRLLNEVKKVARVCT